MNIFEKLNKIPEFCLSHWLFRIPIAIIFIQQGLDKLPVDAETAADFGLPVLVWWFVAYGELGGGIGLLVGGLLTKPWFPILDRCYIPDIGDMLTRFSGITICCIMTGVIWVGEPTSFWDVLLYDNLHVLLWVGGLFFALRGNRT
jgi:putative oxidoreductase|tara:strand:- start:2099 stop:2533 length:435 start_codon:yes stop_codon:yes gene_type:complete